MEPLEEQNRIQRACQGDLDAFNQIVLQYQTTIYNYAYYLVRNRETAEDLTQETFIRAFQNLNRYRGGSLRAWLMRIVANASFDELRRLKAHQTLSLTCSNQDGDEFEAESWLRDPAISVEEKVEEQELRRKLLQSINELPPEYRQAILLVDVFEMDYAEAAAAMAVPMGTVKSRLARARLHLRVRLESCTYLAPDPVFTSA